MTVHRYVGFANDVEVSAGVFRAPGYGEMWYNVSMDLSFRQLSFHGLWYSSSTAAGRTIPRCCG